MIALQGLPCDEVAEVTELAKDDYAVSCKDKNRYRVYMNAEGEGNCREAEVAVTSNYFALAASSMSCRSFSFSLQMNSNSSVLSASSR